jgi:hypothetical protein
MSFSAEYDTQNQYSYLSYSINFVTKVYIDMSLIFAPLYRDSSITLRSSVTLSLHCDPFDLNKPQTSIFIFFSSSLLFPDVNAELFDVRAGERISLAIAR